MVSQNKKSASHTAAPAHGNRERSKQQGRQLQPAEKVVQEQTHSLPAETQQWILNIFTQAFSVLSQPANFRRVIQEVKGHLYNRDFLAAFSKREYLDVYAARWSAARALAYTDIFTYPSRSTWFEPLLNPTVTSGPNAVPLDSQTANELSTSSRYPVADTDQPVSVNSITNALSGTSLLQSSAAPTFNPDPQAGVVCIGGGAGAEVVALAATIRHIHSKSSKVSKQFGQPIKVLAVDIADWSGPLQNILTTLKSSDEVSHPASSSSSNLHGPEKDSSIDIVFEQHDILQVSLDWLRSTLKEVKLVTIMFTLNELFSVSLPKTTALLLNLTEVMPIDAHLVVVDSPGSYSEIQIGKSGQEGTSTNTKRYPMKWLLDHTLLNVAGLEDDVKWLKIEDEDSKWFRVDMRLNLKYGIDLENCRYQIHVFRKVR